MVAALALIRLMMYLTIKIRTMSLVIKKSNSLIIPVIESSLSHLEMGTADTLGQLVEEGHHHLRSICQQ